MKVTLPSKLSALRSVSAAQLKAMYDAVAGVVNGNLDWQNFAPRAGFGLDRKVAPRSIFVLAAQQLRLFTGDGTLGDPSLSNSGPSVVRWLLPTLAPRHRRLSATVIGWTMTQGGPNAGTIASGDVKLRHTTGGVTTDKDTFAIPAGVAAASLLFSRALGAPFSVSPGDLLEAQISAVVFGGGGTRIRGYSVAVWLKMDHLP